MNKSIAVQQLTLPYDILDHICSLLYYTKEQTLQNNKIKYTKVVNDLFYTVRIERTSPFISIVVIYNIQCRFDTTLYMCICGNYRYPLCKRNCRCLL